MFKLTVLILLGLIAYGVWRPDLASDAPRGAVRSSVGPPLTMSLRGAQRDPMRYVGEVPWEGPKMRSAVMRVYCAEGTFVVGEVAGYYIALNGHTSQWSDELKVYPSSGTERSVFSTDRRYLEQLGLVERGADAIDFNRPSSAGLQMGLAACKA